MFFRSPFTGKVRTFDPTPVEQSHPLAGARAFPVLGGTAAYKPADLVELLQVQRQSSDAEAADEVRDMPWHLFHECNAPPATDEAAENTERDRDLLRRATDLVVSTQFGSASMVQRHLGVSFAKASRLLDELEEHGVVGPVQEAQSRAVLVRPDMLAEVLTSIGISASR